MRRVPGPSRSYFQQETKWSWESMMDEMAEALGMDPVQFRLMHITRLKPGDTRHPYDSFPTVEVLQEGAKAFGWEKRNPVAGRQVRDDSSGDSAWACRSIMAG